MLLEGMTWGGLTAQQILIKVLCVVGGTLWTWVEPTVPFALLSVFAVMVDCISAWRLNRRLRRKYGPKAADGKLKSQHMGKMISDLGMLFLVMLIAEGVDQFVVSAFTLPLSNAVACIFLFKTMVSITENESSCNDKMWALFLQRYLIDKSKRHLNVDFTELVKKDKKHYKKTSTAAQAEEVASSEEIREEGEV